MSRPDPDLEGPLAEFARLAPNDQRAVLRQLAKPERTLIERLLHPPRAPASPPPRRPAKTLLSSCSPWLQKYVGERLADGDSGAMTSAGRATLRTLALRVLSAPARSGERT